MMLDVGPIGVFIYSYFLLALRRILALSWPVALGVLAGFMALSIGLAVWVPRTVLDGSSGYFPALTALFVIGWPKRGSVLGRELLVAGSVFAVSLILRIVDLQLCGAFPLGTHYLYLLAHPQLSRNLRGTARRARRANGKSVGTPYGVLAKFFTARRTTRRYRHSSAAGCGPIAPYHATRRQPRARDRTRHRHAP